MQSKPRGAEIEQEELHLFVLDVLRHDVIEQVSSIVRLLNDSSGCVGWREFWPHDFSAAEVHGALFALAQDGYVKVLREATADDGFSAIPSAQLDPCEFGDLWFGITEKGRRLLDKWRPPHRDTNVP